MRYFLQLAYNGTRFFGWQRQPEQITVQQALEDAMTTILGRPMEVVGCGRTDTGVHAKSYFAHFDFDSVFPESFLRRLNKFIGPDIAIYQMKSVSGDAHARFDAVHRAYEYHLTFRKDPFRLETAYYYPFPEQIDRDLMQKAASLLMKYDEFAPFCKSNTDVKTMRCDLRKVEWVSMEGGQDMVFHIAADRFLRGMVRLIVGMCIEVGRGKTTLTEVSEAMDYQTRLKRAQSAPPQGLFLTDIRYPFFES